MGWDLEWKFLELLSEEPQHVSCSTNQPPSITINSASHKFFGSFEDFFTIFGSGLKNYSKALIAGLKGSFCLTGRVAHVYYFCGKWHFNIKTCEVVEVDIFDTTYFWRIGDLQM